MKTIKVPKYMAYIYIFSILVFAMIFYFAMRDGNECLNNPLVYGAKKATTPATVGVMCQCSFLNPDYAPLYFDDDEIRLFHNYSDPVLPVDLRGINGN